MDYLDLQLTNSALDPKFPESIKMAISLGKKTLNKYYDKTDHSEIYRIVMGEWYISTALISLLTSTIMTHLVLHPRNKLDYFKKAGWKKAWIDTARTIVQDEFERSYMKPVDIKIEESMV